MVIIQITAQFIQFVKTMVISREWAVCVTVSVWMGSQEETAQMYSPVLVSLTNHGVIKTNIFSDVTFLTKNSP